MNNSFSTPISDIDERDDYPKVTQADLDRATLRVGLKPVSRKHLNIPLGNYQAQGY
jgi:hypothetical protein